MNDLQTAEFDILREFINVCEKLGLRYYLVCGSALGAVKYHGFIPWDDDVDVALPRKDYEMFCRRAGEFLPNYLFVQNYHTDRYFPSIYTKLRNRSTTFIEKGSETIDMVHGVYIDVFPLDGHPRAGIKSSVFELKKRLCVAGISAKFKHDSKVKDVLYFPLKLIASILPPNYFARKYDRLVRRYPPDDSELWCNYGNSKLKIEYADRTQYGAGKTESFEGVDVCVPADCDAYLTQKYGDWRADLPQEQQVGHHYYVMCDLQTPYSDHIVRVGRGKIKIK